MEDSFSSARMDSTVINNYQLKKLKNINARDFIIEYINSKGEMTERLKLLACRYEKLKKGSLDDYFIDTEINKVELKQLTKIKKEIVENSNNNFIKFYDSYRTKINKGYKKEIIDNSFSDLKTAYFTYRKVRNTSWNLTEDQITAEEMTNLYNLLVSDKNSSFSNKENDDNSR